MMEKEEEEEEMEREVRPHTHTRTSCTYGDCLDRHLNAHSMHVVPLTLGCPHATHVHVV